MKLLNVDTLDQAREKLLSRAKLWTIKTEIVPSPDSSGRILAGDLFASQDIPGFRRSTVDGYAVISGDTSGAGESSPVFLTLAGSVSMGKPADFSLCPGECAYVPTGGMLPEGADAMVMVEYTEASGKNIMVYEPAAPGMGLAEAGEDLAKGDLLLSGGTLIRPQETGALAAAGVTKIPVFSPLSISLISTGDEIVPPEAEPCPGEVRDINSFALRALAMKRGYNVISVLVLPDDEERLEAALRNEIITSDIVAISGGSSQGEKDLTADLIGRVAKPGVFTHGLAMKPGKPTILGWDDESKTLLAGLPGHPVSALMVFELLLGWLPGAVISEQFKMKNEKIKKNNEEFEINNEQLSFNNEKFMNIGKREFPVPARISCNLPGAAGRTLCQPVVLRYAEDGYLAEPVFGKSGMITTLTRSDGYIIVDLNREGLKKGEPVLVHLF